MNPMFSSNLAYFRKRANLTQRELAKELDISQSALAMYERGLREPSFEQLEAIADYFNVNMSTLLGEDDKKGISKYDILEWLATSSSKEDVFDFIQQAAQRLRDLEEE